MPEEQEGKPWHKTVYEWFEGLYEWVQENLGDPAIAEEIRDDMGLAPGEDVDPGEFDGWPDETFDPDEASFEETVAEIETAVTTIKNTVDLLSGEHLTGAEALWLLARLSGTETVRLHSPFTYAMGTLLGFIADDPYQLPILEPERFLWLLRGEEPPEDLGDQAFERFSGGTVLLVMAAEAIGDAFELEALEATTGWDPEPGAPPQEEKADRASTRATTISWIFERDGDAEDGDGVPQGRVMLTVIPVPPEFGGPGIALSLGGGADATVEGDDHTIELTAGLTGGVDLFIPWGDSGHDVQLEGGPEALLRLDVKRGKEGTPALLIGEPDATRVEVSRLLAGVEVGADRAAVRIGVDTAELIIDLSQEDGFLASLPGGEIRVRFGLVVTADTEGGLRLEGGTRAEVTLPISESLFGVFKIQHLKMALGPSPDEDRHVALELSGAFGLDIGPFRVTIDRIGMLLDARFGEGNLGFLDVELGFKPPNGIGLVLEAAAIRGGGYLYLDPERGEYAGVLELEIEAGATSLGLKALGIITTRMPDGSEGWALLLLLYFDIPPINLGFGFTLNGVGGLIGLQHAVSIDALQSGLRDGVLDDVLFPEDPVADAPRLINQLKTVFPLTPGALAIGPMFDLSWGGEAKVLIIRLGLLVQFDNAIGGEGSAKLNNVTILGQVKTVVPDDKTPVIRLTVDFLGFYDVPGQRLGFQARLRDSKVLEKLTLEGMMVVQLQMGENASFVLAAGGFHPRFEDVPEGLPAKIDRLAIKVKIKVVELKVLTYFAVTPATVQTGLKAELKAKFGPVSIEGSLGFDAIFYFKPTFRFEADLDIKVAVKFKGRSLMGVGVHMTLWGPSQWRAKGKVTFSILFWDVSKSFDTRSGTETPALEGSSHVAEMLAEEFSRQDNWTAQLPAGGDGVASMGSVADLDRVLAHPLGMLGVTQRVAPLGLEMNRFGQTNVDGPRRVGIGNVTVNGQELVAEERTPLREQFARSHFVDMTNEEKLSSPSFETFDAGVAVSTDEYITAEVDAAADLSYETEILEPEPELSLGRLRDAFEAGVAGTTTLAMDAAAVLARHGAAGVAARRRALREGPADGEPLSTGRAPVALVHTDTFAAATTLEGSASTSEALAGQDASDGQMVVEAFELELD